MHLSTNLMHLVIDQLNALSNITNLMHLLIDQLNAVSNLPT